MVHDADSNTSARYSAIRHEEVKAKSSDATHENDGGKTAASSTVNAGTEDPSTE